MGVSDIIKKIFSLPLRIALLYALIASAWIIGSGYFSLSASADQATLARFELTKGLGFVLVTSVLLYLLLTMHAVTGQAATGNHASASGKSRPLLLLGLLITVVPALLLLITWKEAPRLEQDSLNDLSYIAELKAMQIENWLDERHRDGMSLSEDPGFVRRVAAALSSNDEKTWESLRHQLESFRIAYNYQTVSLLNPAGDIRLQLGAVKDETAPRLMTLNSNHDHHIDMINGEVLTREHPSSREHIHHSHGDQGVRLHFSFGLRRTPQEAPLATLQLDIEPERFLFPYISLWSTASASGETLLAEAENNRVLFLTPLRHKPAQTGTLTHPLSSNTLPAAVALRNGGSGTFRGHDYRGVEVLAAYHPVENTDWQLIAKLDRDEVMAPLYTLLTWVGLITLLSVVMIGALLLRMWQQQQRVANLTLEAEQYKTDALLQQFFDLPFVGIAITSPQSKQWLRFNERLCQILGYPREELEKMSWVELTHPDDLDADLAEFDKVMRGESDGYSMDKRYLRKDGSVVNAYVDIKCIRKADGNVDYFVAMVQDIGERKAAEQRLRDSEARLRTLINSIPDLIWLKDAEGVYLACNPMFERFFGASEADISGKTDYDFIDRELADFFRENDRKAMNAGKPSSNEETLTFANDGYTGTFDTIKTPLLDASGHLIGVLGIARDITERKEAMARLKRLSQLYATLSQTNQSIVRSRDENEMFEQVCRNAVDNGGFIMAWVGRINEESGIVEPVASYGDDSGYVDAANIRLTAESPSGNGPLGRALRSGEPYWCQDFLNDDVGQPWHDRAKAAGFAAAAALPIYRNGTIYGGFTLYSDTTFAFDEAARDLLIEMATDISFALDHFDQERQRQQAEKRLKLVIKGSKDAPWDWDLEQDHFWYSPRWWELLGYEINELPANSQLWRELTHPDDLPAVEQALASILQPGNEWEEVECRYRHKDGHYIPTLIRGFASRDENGKAVRISGTTMDLSERKQLEEQLRQQRDELSRAKQILDSHLDNSPVGVIEWDPAFHITRWSSRAEAIFGWREEEVLGKHPSEFRFIYEEDAGRVGEIINALTIGELKQNHIANRNVIRDGSVINTEWYNSALYDEQGKLLSVLSLVQDITEQHQAEEELRQRENLLQKTFDILPIGLWFADARGQLLRGNPAGQAIWGGEPHATPDEYGIFKAWRLPSGDPVEPDDWALAHTIREGVTVTDELLKIETFDGKQKVILNYTAPVTDEQGRVEGAIVVNLDVTERQQEQQQLQERVDELNRWYEATLGREKRMLELKQEINRLLKQAGHPIRYPSAETQTSTDNPPKEPPA